MCLWSLSLVLVFLEMCCFVCCCNKSFTFSSTGQQAERGHSAAARVARDFWHSESFHMAGLQLIACFWKQQRWQQQQPSHATVQLSGWLPPHLPGSPPTVCHNCTHCKCIYNCQRMQQCQVKRMGRCSFIGPCPRGTTTPHMQPRQAQSRGGAAQPFMLPSPVLHTLSTRMRLCCGPEQRSGCPNNSLNNNPTSHNIVCRDPANVTVCGACLPYTKPYTALLLPYLIHGWIQHNHQPCTCTCCAHSCIDTHGPRQASSVSRHTTPLQNPSRGSAVAVNEHMPPHHHHHPPTHTLGEKEVSCIGS